MIIKTAEPLKIIDYLKKKNIRIREVIESAGIIVCDETEIPFNNLSIYPDDVPLLVNSYKGQIRINDAFVIDNKSFIVIAGPCAVESYEQLSLIARGVKEHGANALRAGAFKQRTSPYSFQGLQEEGLQILHRAGKENNLPIVSEITDVRQLDLFLKYVDIIQVGARNMYNYELLKALGKTTKPILLKRSFAATTNEFLLAAEYILKEGNSNVILCERGIRTFANDTRNTLDFGSILLLRKATSLPIIVDPSHASGRRDLVVDLSVIAKTSMANGVMVEVHTDPNSSFSDAKQTIDLEQFALLMDKLK